MLARRHFLGLTLGMLPALFDYVPTSSKPIQARI